MKFIKLTLLPILILLFASALFAAPINLQKIIPNFQKYAQKAMNETKTPGMAIAIVQNNKIIYAKGFGVRESGKPKKVNKKTVFQIGSISKSFTTALLAMMIDEHKLAWNEQVIDILPNFRMHDPYVTREFRIDDLVSQRSGMPAHAADIMVFLGYSKNNIKHALRYIKPVSSFRSKYAYQNSLFLVAAEILEKITNKSYEKLLQEKIFGPLHMNDSSVTLNDFLMAKNSAWVHHKVNGKIVPYARDWPYLNWSYIYAPAGGINSNVTDMAKWLMVQINDGKYNNLQLISTANIKQMHRPHIYSGKKFDADNYYDLSWVSRDYTPYPIIFHNGETTGAHTMAAFIPQMHIGIIILTNTTGSMLPEALAFEFFDRALNKPEKDWNHLCMQDEKETNIPTSPTIRSPSLPLTEYAGTYSNNMFGKVKVIAQKNKLELTIGPKNVKMTLTPWYRDVFSLSWPAMDINGNESKVFFTLDQNGKPQKMLIDLLADTANGLFVKIKDIKT